MTYPDQNQYDGEWKLGKFDGFGKFSWKNGETYEGYYKEGVRQGKGRYTFKNNNWY